MSNGRLIGLQLPEELDAVVRQNAAQDGRAVSDYIRHLLKMHFGFWEQQVETHLPEREVWKQRMMKFAKHVREVEYKRNHGKCDGNHAGPRCADPECWNQ